MVVAALSAGHRDEGPVRASFRTSCRASDAEKHVTELDGRGVADARLVLAADHRHHPDAAGLRVSVLRECNRVDALSALPPQQLGQINPLRVEPCRLAGEMAVMTLLYTAGPAALEISRDPSAIPGRPVQAEVRPGKAVLRVLQNAAPFADSSQSRSEAAVVIAKLVLVRLAGGPVPEPAPPLARRVSDHGMRPGILACIAVQIPCRNTRQVEIAPVSLDEECGNWRHVGAIARRIVRMVSGDEG